MSEANKNAAQELTSSIDDAYSHGYSEALGGNWEGEPHKNQADGVDVFVGGKYYALFPEDDKKIASIVDVSSEGVAEEHIINKSRTKYGREQQHITHNMKVANGSNGVSAHYRYEDNYDASGKSLHGGPYNTTTFGGLSKDGVKVYREGPNGEQGAVKRLTGDRASRAQEIMQRRAARKIKASVDNARRTGVDEKLEQTL